MWTVAALDRAAAAHLLLEATAPEVYTIRAELAFTPKGFPRARSLFRLACPPRWPVHLCRCLDVSAAPPLFHQRTSHWSCTNGRVSCGVCVFLGDARAPERLLTAKAPIAKEYVFIRITDQLLEGESSPVLCGGNRRAQVPECKVILIVRRRFFVEPRPHRRCKAHLLP